MNEVVEFIRENKIKVAIAVPSGYLLLNRLFKGYRQNRMKSAIREHKEKCKRDFDAIQEELKTFSLDQKERQRIFDLTSVELQQELKDGQLSPLDVLQVYQLQALESNKTINAITEPLLDAKVVAGALDPNSSDMGVLFGIPISLKENYQLKGKLVTIGLAQRLDKTYTEEAVLVQVIKSQGAVPFVRTNIPQTMMTYESSNPIYGKTNNPFDLKRSSGGSSSGEGALIGSGASVIGLGNDIGGSIRVPCHFCGCYGLKPTTERLSRKGTLSLSGGQTVVKGANGPMSRDFEGLVLTMKALLCDLHFRLDPQVPPIKFRDEIYESTKPLTIGFYVNDGFTQAVPAVQRAVLLAKQALEARGHTVVEFTPPRINYAIPELYIASVSGDRGEQFKQYLRKDLVDPTVRDLMMATTIPKWSTWLLSWLLKSVLGEKKTGHVVGCRNGKSSVFEWFQQALKVQAYKDEFLNAWQDQKLDAVICPPFACTALPHGDVIKVILAGSYSLLYNIVNYPAGVLPVTKVMAGDVQEMKDYPKSTLVEKSIHKVTVGSEGLPVGVQCVSLPFQEELVLRVMREVRDGLQKTKSS